MLDHECISKSKVLSLFDDKLLEKIEMGTTKGLKAIHKYLFDETYDFAGLIRDVNIAKGNFRFAHAMYLNEILLKIDSMPSNNFDEIIKTSNMNEYIESLLI